MLLIADSGSTKTSWRLVDENKKISHFLTEGLNPYFKSQGEIVEEIKSDLIPHFPKGTKVSKIYFYGAGCSSSGKCDMVKGAFAQCFPDAMTTVNHDILAAARATCAHSEGIVCILGTGSNSCLYNGKNIVNVIGGLGYILGDEGSGSHLGKNLIEAYLNHELPDQLRKEFDDTYHLTKEEIEKRVYEKPQANRFLASFSRFIGEHKNDPYLSKLIESCLDSFIEKHVCRYESYDKKPIHFVGSIANYYADFLRNVSKRRNISIGKILPYPIEELTLFHLAAE
ncbi:MAG TPA: BadF/BadG/BcrA/BcrD ATPase family protein [Bacteroidia bacterium]|jgi:glucosamine kinase|nr:BadF/BadG/BcrA/BcrD ATPase family protein [Bacteroidia bacterium]